MKGLSIEKTPFIEACVTILDLEYNKESQLISEPNSALKSAPPKAIP